MNTEMLTDKTFSGKLNEYKDVCRLMKTALPKNEQIPIWLLRVLAFRKSVNFRVFYEDDRFCGILYTAENDKYIFVLYLAVNDRIRSKGYGTSGLSNRTPYTPETPEEIVLLTTQIAGKESEKK